MTLRVFSSSCAHHSLSTSFSHFPDHSINIQTLNRSKRQLARERNGRLLRTHQLVSSVRGAGQGADTARHQHLQQTPEVSAAVEPDAKADRADTVWTDCEEASDLVAQGRWPWIP